MKKTKPRDQRQRSRQQMPLSFLRYDGAWPLRTCRLKKSVFKHYSGFYGQPLRRNQAGSQATSPAGSCQDSSCSVLGQLEASQRCVWTPGRWPSLEAADAGVPTITCALSVLSAPLNTEWKLEKNK